MAVGLGRAAVFDDRLSSAVRRRVGSQQRLERMMNVVIVRDRASAGGGIHNYYEALRPHLTAACRFVDVGRGHEWFGASGRARQRATWTRLVADWSALLLQLLRLPDLVHLNPGLDASTRRSLRRDAVNLWLAKLFRRPVLVFWRGWDNHAVGAAEFPGGKNGLLCKTYQLADAHVVLSREFEQDLRRWRFSAPIHLETTVAADEVLERSPKKRILEGKPINLLFLSRIEVEKGVFELFETFSLLEGRQPGRYTLTLAGDGESLVGLRQRVKDLGLQGVAFPGYVTAEQKIQCYLNASIFCFLSSHGEGMPNAVLEAMAMGLPIVSSDAGGLRDVLCDGETGFVLQPERSGSLGTRFCAEAVADRIEKIASDPDLYDRISAHNQLLAQQRFAAAKVAQRLESIYRQVLTSCAHGIQKFPAASVK